MGFEPTRTICLDQTVQPRFQFNPVRVRVLGQTPSSHSDELAHRVVYIHGRGRQ